METNGFRHMQVDVSHPEYVLAQHRAHLGFFLRHTATVDAATKAQDLTDIPDDDEHAESRLSKDMAGLNVSGNAPPVASIPDMDDIPDMEEDGLEADDDAAAAPTVTAGPSAAYVMDSFIGWLSLLTCF